jgi:hypothetical protein
MKPMQLVGGEPRWGTLASYYEPAPADASPLDRGSPGTKSQLTSSVAQFDGQRPGVGFVLREDSMSRSRLRQSRRWDFTFDVPLIGRRLCENSDALLQSRIFASSSGNQAEKSFRHRSGTTNKKILNTSRQNAFSHSLGHGLPPRIRLQHDRCTPVS